MVISWQPLLLDYTNGPITGYDVTYTRQGASNGGTETTNKLSVQISNLLPYTGYNVNVRARNKAGPGPVSTTLIIVTKEDGNMILFITLLHVGSFDSLLAWCVDGRH